MHDPVVAVLRSQQHDIPTTHAAWVLGMEKVSARRLIKKKVSWLRPEAEVWDSGMPVFEFPDLYGSSVFIPTLADAERFAMLIADRVPIHRAAELMQWPKQVVPSLEAAIAMLQSNGMTLVPCQGTDFEIKVPRGAGSDAELDDLRRDPRYWVPLAHMFEEWMQVSAIKLVEGIPATEEMWTKWLELVSPLKQFTWKRLPIRTRNIFQPCAIARNKHSVWPKLRWMMLCAWLQIQIDRSSSEH